MHTHATHAHTHNEHTHESRGKRGVPAVAQKWQVHGAPGCMHPVYRGRTALMRPHTAEPAASTAQFGGNKALFLPAKVLCVGGLHGLQYPTQTLVGCDRPLVQAPVGQPRLPPGTSAMSCSPSALIRRCAADLWLISFPPPATTPAGSSCRLPRAIPGTPQRW